MNNIMLVMDIIVRIVVCGMVMVCIHAKGEAMTRNPYRN